MSASLNPYLDIAPEVAAALQSGQAVVALESTIICHGMPYPRNVETATSVEATVRAAGAIPATIAILDGRLKVGLSATEVQHLGQQGHSVTKCSRRDLPFVVARRQNGATTVAATMLIATMAGIRVLATGGIGGVHRDVEETLDVSADLDELARSDVVVVCAGVKSILDIGRTLEYLETRGVPVIGYQTSTLPAFFCRDSGFALEYRADTPAEVAAIHEAQRELGLAGGMLVGVPVPAENGLPHDEIDGVIRQALAEMRQQGISGKATTPFLLASIVRRTGGRSLDANIALVINNARVAAEIAVEIGHRICGIRHIP